MDEYALKIIFFSHNVCRITISLSRKEVVILRSKIEQIKETLIISKLSLQKPYIFNTFRKDTFVFRMLFSRCVHCFPV